MVSRWSYCILGRERLEAEDTHVTAFLWSSYLTLGLLAVCTVVGLIIAIRFRREVDDDLIPPTAKEVLDPLEKAFYSGLMHPAEIERIRESIRNTQFAKVARPKASATPPSEIKMTSEGPIFLGDASAGHSGADGSDAS